MPVYAPGTTGVPLQGLYPGGVPAQVYNNETVVVSTSSLAVNLAGLLENPAASVSCEITFNQAPGAFEFDIQESDTDADGSYIAITNAILNAANAGNVSRFDLSPIRAKFIRLFCKTAPANGGTKVTAKFTR